MMVSGSDHIYTKEGKPFDVPEGGSLGLLALGYKGLIAWRAKRAKTVKHLPTSPLAQPSNEKA